MQTRLEFNSLKFWKFFLKLDLGWTQYWTECQIANFEKKEKKKKEIAVLWRIRPILNMSAILY